MSHTLRTIHQLLIHRYAESHGVALNLGHYLPVTNQKIHTGVFQIHCLLDWPLDNIDQFCVKHKLSIHRGHSDAVNAGFMPPPAFYSRQSTVPT